MWKIECDHYFETLRTEVVDNQNDTTTGRFEITCIKCGHTEYSSRIAKNYPEVIYREGL